MIKFKVDYWYKFTGNEDDYYWNNETKIMSDNKWHKCIYVGICKNYAKFEGMKYGHYWEKYDFIESKYNPYVKKLLEEI